MPIKIIEETINHKLSPTGSLLMTVTFGNAQLGGNKLTEGSNTLAKGSIQNFQLCASPDQCNGRTLLLVSNIVDVNPATNNISILIEFSSGVGQNSYLFTTVADENGIVRYRITITLNS